MKFDDVENKWRAFQKTNHLCDPKHLQSTNLVHEIFFLTDTNRVQIIRDWKETQLLLFNTTFVPATNFLSAQCFNYSHHGLMSLQFGRSHKNVYLSYFSGSLFTNELKVELVYEPATNVPPVKKIEIGKDSIKFDDEYGFAIPARGN